MAPVICDTVETVAFRLRYKLSCIIDRDGRIGSGWKLVSEGVLIQVACSSRSLRQS